MELNRTHSRSSLTRYANKLFARQQFKHLLTSAIPAMLFGTTQPTIWEPIKDLYCVNNIATANHEPGYSGKPRRFVLKSAAPLPPDKPSIFEFAIVLRV